MIILQLETIVVTLCLVLYFKYLICMLSCLSGDYYMM